ncbi:MAG TPA: SPOR domain-containing protein [Rhizobiaceae bacterium]
MADKNHLKIADQVDLADDDPFAELTRIMGFDPRQPARQAAQQNQVPAFEHTYAEHAVEDDDFSLDLEKELLGEFAVEDEMPTAEASYEAAAPVAEASTAEAPFVPEAAAAELDFDFAADFDAAMAASDDPELPAEPEAEFDLALTEDDMAALDAVADQPPQAEVVQPARQAEADTDFDFGFTTDDIQALDAEAFAPAAVEAPLVAQADDAGFDAAMADIDMDFGDAFAAESRETAPINDAVEAKLDIVATEPSDDDLHLFDEADFRLEDEPSRQVAAAAEAEPQPEIDESAFSFDDDFHLDEARPVEDQAADQAADEFSFDETDLTLQEFPAEAEFAAGREAAEPMPVDAESSADFEPDVEMPEAVAAPVPSEPPSFELSAPRYEPRRLPTSPMDIAAEEFRQREAAATPVVPDFNLEDELNALLGNIRSNPAASAPTPLPVSPPVVMQPDQFPPYEAGQSDYEPLRFRPEQTSVQPEPASFDPPVDPADIEDDLKWDLDDVFAPGATPESADDEHSATYAEEGQYDTYAHGEHRDDAYAEAGEPADAHTHSPEAEDDLAALDFHDLEFEPAHEEPRSTSYGYAAAGVAAGAAASSLGSVFPSRSFETAAQARVSDLPRAPGGHFAELPQAAATDDTFSPHRDPVVRGNPLKEDPLDIINQLAEKYSKKEPVTPYGRAMGVARGTVPFAAEAVEDQDIDISSAFEEQPDVETIEVADQAVALADDLDIPELAEEPDLPPVSDYDDLDAEFSSLLNEMNAAQPTAQPATGQGGAYASFDAGQYESQMGVALAGSHAVSPAAKTYDDDPGPDSFALDADELPGSQPVGRYAADDYDYDPDLDQEIAPQYLGENGQKPKSRGLLLAGVVGGVALVGAIGAFALSYGGGSGSDTPALVRADEGPLKVKPENPGGATVPNQQNKVYETVAGEGAADAPQQQKLVTTAEEPVDVTPPPPAIEEDVAIAPSGKSEDRIEQIVQEAQNQTDDEIVAVTPRKVRTMVVKPDGTLVEREDQPASANGQAETIAAAVPEAGPAPAVPEATGALTGSSAPEEMAAARVTPAEEALPPAQEQVAATEAASANRAALPDTAPIAPLRPADQPIDVVGEVKPDQVAAVTTARPDGNWAMQIASQPSEAAAQSSYQDLVRRYANVLQGKEVSIVKAEIAGKGTFWRVRVPAASRNEAITLCENYKAAGGNCFVSR